MSATQHLSDAAINQLLTGIYTRRIESAQLSLEAETADDPRILVISHKVADQWERMATMAAERAQARRAA